MNVVRGYLISFLFSIVELKTEIDFLKGAIL